MKVFRFFISFLLIISGCFCIFLYINFNSDSEPINVLNVSYKNKHFVIKLSNISDDVYCSLSLDDKKKWNKVKNGVCDYDVSAFGNYKLYIKDHDNVFLNDEINKVFDVETSKDRYYLAVSDRASFNVKVLGIGNYNVSYDGYDSGVISVKGNKIYAKKKGSTKIGIYDKKIKVVVTDLIDKMPNKYNYSRRYLSCGAFSQDEEKLLDKILASRISDVGFGTRAGVVAAARFLTLEFPYKISYFSENGRLTDYNSVDGEGRFYHKGLYLTSDKYSSLSYIDKGPKPWGCYMYSRPSKGMRANGLDCSGFTTWVLYNGGFDIGDFGAHGKRDELDLNSFGDEVKLTYDVSVSDKIKAGDLLGEVSVSEGHSAIVVGVDKNNYYVAESLWISPLGVNINTYRKSSLYKHFETVNLMDSYYKKDGNYSAMWY